MAHYKRRNYLINPKFQIKFSLMFCVILLLSSIIYPLTIYDLISKYVEMVALKTPSLKEGLQHQKDTLLMVLTFWQLGFTALVFVICIFFSHKIAGPMYKLTMYLQSVRSGDVTGKLFFRKGDHFKEVADELNQTLGSLKDKYHQDMVFLDEASDKLNSISANLEANDKEVVGKIAEKLKSIQEQAKID